MDERLHFVSQPTLTPGSLPAVGVPAGQHLPPWFDGTTWWYAIGSTWIRVNTLPAYDNVAQRDADGLDLVTGTGNGDLPKGLFWNSGTQVAPIYVQIAP